MDTSFFVLTLRPARELSPALAYEHGIDLERNVDEAMSRFRFAAENGNAQAMMSLGLRLPPNNPAEAYYWLRRAGAVLTAQVAGGVARMIEHNLAVARARLTPDGVIKIDKLVTAGSDPP